MRMTTWKWGVVGLGLLGVLLSACGDEGSSGPTTEEFSKEREALQAKIAESGPAKSRRKAPVKAAPARGGKSGSGTGFGEMDRNFSYDPAGKRDPFRDFKWERPDRLQLSAITSPLEQYDVGQLTLVAVVWKTGNARALIQDPSGESYIIGEGARLGKNAGLVKLIRDGLVVVTETYVDYLGEETAKDVEMRMRRNEGE